MISQGCTLCIKTGSMVLCMGPHSTDPGGLFWTRRRAGVGFRWVVPDTHDYFLRRPKAGAPHPSSKSGSDMIISCGDLRLVGSNRHRKVSQHPRSRGLALQRGGMVFQRLHQNPHHIWCCARSGWWPCGSMGWCSKKLHQNSYPGRLVFSLLRRWGGVPKSCPRIRTQYTTN